MSWMLVAALSRGVYIVETGGLGYPNTVAAYIVAGEKYSAIIDTGYASSARRVASAIVESGVASNLRYIIPTHAHLDHCGATSELASIFKGSRVYAHERALPHLINPSRLLESVKSIYEEHILAAMGGMKPLDESLSQVMEDGEEIDLGGVTIRSIYTHGHAPHHLSIQIVEKGYIATGDAVPSRYPFTGYFIPNTVPPKYDLDQALRSIGKIFELEPRLLLTPHYGPIFPSPELQGKYEEVIVGSVELARRLINGGGGVEEIRSSLVTYLTGQRVFSMLHPYIQSAIKLSALALYQTYKSST
ncbi:MAG: MBL fold metallo-hydrolase [Nitrososphaerota archaeon]